MDNPAVALLLQVLMVVGVIAFIIWIISVGVRMGTKPDTRKYTESWSASRAMAEMPPAPGPAQDNGPGTFLVIGVRKGSGQDAREKYVADSPANAKVKGELDGLIVTAVHRLPK